MARLIDADALKDNMFHYAAPEMMWDRGDIEHKIDEMPTIDAIPVVEWLTDMLDKTATTDVDLNNAIFHVLVAWEKQKKWAAEHPEPVYPSWYAWLANMGIVPIELPPDQAVFVTDIGLLKKIPADIAEKLGIEPKEG